MGYDGSRYRVQANLQAANVDEVVEVMLGLRRADVLDLKAYDVRFGIEVPVDHFDGDLPAKLLINAPPVDTCTIRVKGRGLSPPAVFAGEVFWPPLPKGVPEASWRMLIKAHFFVLDLHSSGKLAFNFKLDELLDSALPLEEWRHHLRLLEVLGEGRVEFDVEGHKPESPRSTLPVQAVQPLPQEPWIAALTTTVAQGEALLMMAGAEGKLVTLASLADAAQMIDQAHARLFEPARVLPQTFVTEGRLEPGVPVHDIDVLMVDYAMVAGVPFGYACRLSMRPETAGDGLLWRQVDFQPLKISVIEDSVEAFRNFAESMRAETNIQNLMMRDLADPRGDAAEADATDM